MQAKEFLLKIRKFDKLIENKLAEIQQWKDISTSATANMFGERVASSHNPRSKENAICKYMDLEAEIQKDVENLIKTKKDVISVIEQLDTIEYDVLHKIYVQSFTLQDVASLYQRNYGWATTTHGRALKNVQIILNRREEKS